MATFTDEDWAAAEASRQERFPGDAPISFEAAARVAGPRVLVHGGAPARGTVGAACRAVCEILSEGIGGELVIFEASQHNPQLEEAGRFNALLRRVWAARAG
jgi:pimeloyl-ACP methyl ester carboxylesterase